MICGHCSQDPSRRGHVRDCARARFPRLSNGLQRCYQYLRTDPEGVRVHEILVSARSGSVCIADYTWTIDIGSLDPMNNQAPDECVLGLQAHLFNLGYDVGAVNGALGARTVPLCQRRVRQSSPGNLCAEGGEWT